MSKKKTVRGKTFDLYTREGMKSFENWLLPKAVNKPKKVKRGKSNG